MFHRGTLVAICGTLGHHLDVGGMRPGSYAGEAVEIYQEGLRIPPIKLFERGRLDERLFDLIACNIRLPDITIGDLRSQTAALDIGRDGVVELIDRYGTDTLQACMKEATVASEARLRARIRELPEGRFRGTYYVDDDGVVDEPITIATTLTIENGSIHVDFTGTDRQRRSPINATLSSCESATYFAVLSILDPTIPANYGVYRPIRITAPEGTVVNALPPAPVVGRNAITHTIVNALTIALAEVVPERITAAYYGMSNVYILSGSGGSGDDRSDDSRSEDGRPGDGLSGDALSGDGHREDDDADGRGWIFFDIEVGGGGGRPAKDGLDCYSQGIHNLANTPIEMVEATYPLRFRHYEFIPDSGGAGRSRGGLGVRRDIELLSEHGALDTQFDKFKVAPFGLFGGGDGATGRLVLNPDGPSPKELASKTVALDLHRGDVVSMWTQGGGGYGAPGERTADAIARDVREGKLTEQAARKHYGYEGTEA